MVCSSTSFGTWSSSRLTAEEASGVKSCARDMLSPRKGHLLATYRPHELALRISHRLALRVNQREVRVRAGQYCPLLGVQPVEARGPLGEYPGEPLRRQATGQRLVDHERRERLDAHEAGGLGGQAQPLLLRGMWGVVRADRGYDAVPHALP